MTESTVTAVGTEDADERLAKLSAALVVGGDAAVDAVCAALADEDWRVRSEAIARAGEVDPIALVPRVVAGIVQFENVGLRNASIDVAEVLGEHIVPALRDAFATLEGPPRRFVVAALGKTAALDATSVLESACDDPDENLVAAALDALARIGGPRAEARILLEVSSSDPYRRVNALDALHRLGGAAPLELVEGAVDDLVLRGVALALLGRTRDPRAVAKLTEALADRSTTHVATAAVALDELAESSDELAEVVADAALTLPEPAIAGLRAALRGGELASRRAAAFLLVSAQRADAVADVLALAADVGLPSAALVAVARWGRPAVEPLLDVLHTSRGHVAALALELAADLTSEAQGDAVRGRVADALRGALATSDDALRDAAIRCLPPFATLDDLVALVALATGPRPEDALRAASVLEQLARTAPAAVAAALDGIDCNRAHGSLCGTLAVIGTDDALARIVSALSAQDARCRRAAVLALSSLEDGRSVESLALALADEDLDVRATAAMVLGRVRDGAGRSVGAERLLHALEHESSVVQVAAIEALVGLAESRAKEPLARLALSGDAAVAAAALHGLRALHDDHTAELAVRAAERGAPEILVAALAVLADRAVPAPAAPMVVDALDHPDWSVRLAAVGIAASLPDGVDILRARLAREAEPIVARALRDQLAEARG